MSHKFPHAAKNRFQLMYIYSSDNSTGHMEQIMGELQGGRPRTEWPQVKHEVRLQRDISSHKRVTVSTWNGEVRIDIRTWEDNFPNKKGLSLTLPRWKTLLSYQEDLTKALRGQSGDKVKYHLGGGQFATANPDYKSLDLLGAFCLPEQ